MNFSSDLIGSKNKCSSCGGNFQISAKVILEEKIDCPYCKNTIILESRAPDQQNVRKFVYKLHDLDNGLEIAFQRKSIPTEEREKAGYLVISLPFAILLAVSIISGWNNLIDPNLDGGYLAFIATVTLTSWILSVYVIIKSVFRPRLSLNSSGFDGISQDKNVHFEVDSLQGFSKLQRSKYRESLNIIDAHDKDKDKFYLLLFKTDGSVQLLSILADDYWIDDLVGLLNKTLKNIVNSRSGVPLFSNGNQGNIIDKLPAASPGSGNRKKAGTFCSSALTPQQNVKPKTTCNSCGAENNIPPQIQVIDSYSCQYCDTHIDLRMLDHQNILDRITSGKLHVKETGYGVSFSDKRYPYKHQTTPLHFAFLYFGFLVAVGTFLMFLFSTGKDEFPFKKTMLFFNVLPLIYYIKSFSARGDRKNSFFKMAKLMIFTQFLPSFGFVAYFLYRITGMINVFKMHIRKTTLMEGYRFGKKSAISLSNIQTAALFRWDILQVHYPSVLDKTLIISRADTDKNGNKTGTWSTYDMRKNAIWGFVLFMNDNQMYTSHYLGDMFSAETIVRYINRQIFENGK